MSSSQKSSEYNKLHKQLFSFSYAVRHKENKVSKKQTTPIILLVLVALLTIWLFLHQYLKTSQTYTVAIIGTNDLHGKVFPTQLIRNDTKQPYKYGGLSYMASMIQTIRQQYQHNVLYFDAGDQFQGGVEASKLISNGQIMNDFFEIVGLNGSSIGNHQFDFGPEFLNQFLMGRSTPNLAANIQSQNNQQDFLPYQKGSHIYILPNGIKIGVIGLSTVETLTTSGGFTGNKFPRYKFMNYKQSILNHSVRLRASGVHAVLIVSHIGDPCDSDMKYAIRTEMIEKEEDECPVDQLTKLIDELPEGIIDGIIQGHRHKTAHQYYRKVPYMGSINGGFYFNVMYLRFNEEKQLIGSSIQSPIAVCEKIFENRKRCDYVTEKELSEAGELVNWQFHNKTVIAHPKLQSLLISKYLPKMAPYLQPLCQNQLYLSRKQFQQSQLSNLMTSLMHQAVPESDFTLINTGAFRTQWIPGILQEQHFYNMFPFENQIQVFSIRGNKLKQMMTILQQSGKRFIQAYGFIMQININNKNPNNHTYKLLSLKMSNGEQISQQKIYKGATISYLLEGGDTFDIIKMKGIQFEDVRNVGDFQEIIRRQLGKIKVIRKDWVIDHNKPRLIVRYNNNI